MVDLSKAAVRILLRGNKTQKQSSGCFFVGFIPKANGIALRSNYPLIGDPTESCRP